MRSRRPRARSGSRFSLRSRSARARQARRPLPLPSTPTCADDDDFFTRVRGRASWSAGRLPSSMFPSVDQGRDRHRRRYGEKGALLTRERTMDYYNIVSASIGFQLGAQSRSVIIVFVTRARRWHSFGGRTGGRSAWNASVAIVTVGAGGSIDRAASPAPSSASSSTTRADVQSDPGRLEDARASGADGQRRARERRGSFLPGPRAKKRARAMASSAAAALAGTRRRLGLGSSKPCVAPS